jgi:hypothetical protein
MARGSITHESMLSRRTRNVGALPRTRAFPDGAEGRARVTVVDGPADAVATVGAAS